MLLQLQHVNQELCDEVVRVGTAGTVRSTDIASKCGCNRYGPTRLSSVYPIVAYACTDRHPTLRSFTIQAE